MKLSKFVIPFLVLSSNTFAEITKQTEIGSGTDQDSIAACTKAIDSARNAALAKTQSYVNSRVKVVNYTENYSQTLSKREELSRQVLATINFVDSRKLKFEDNTCYVEATFEVDTSSIDEFIETERERQRVELEQQKNVSAFQKKLLENKAIYDGLREDAQFLAPKRNNETINVVCDSEAINSCMNAVDKEIIQQARYDIASALNISEQFIVVTVQKDTKKIDNEKLNTTQSRITWVGSYTTEVNILDPYEKENNSLRALVEHKPEVFTKVINRKPFGIGFSYECLTCKPHDEELKALTALRESTIGGQGLMLQVMFNDWFGISSGIFQEEIHYCSKMLLKRCVDTDEEIYSAIAFGPRFDFGLISFEGTRMTYTQQDSSEGGVVMPDPYWRYDISIGIKDPQRTSYVGMGYTYRNIKDTESLVFKEKGVVSFKGMIHF